IPCGRRALEIRKSLLGLKDNKARSSLHYLAYSYDASGDEKQASSLCEEAADAEDYAAIREMTRRWDVDRQTRSKYEGRLKDQSAIELQRDFYEFGRIDFTPLHYAVAQNDAHGIEKRIGEYNQFVNVGDDDGKTPLHHSAEMGLMDVVKLLVEKLRASIGAKDK